ncbi:hypothetical protein CFK37_19435 [Virgibacillus phasianinus]|uniref:Uncharacterized protein n=1 Tax=Virgibacillus phasianinus TaxID=2017483 RepID=A0A220U8E6_9BACI|nr:hypothetical protein [Virgibacillus phasianinus]ASK64166.1 hypothetical protein CFK37_19435 [Virgibacillus phasianinus]
MKKGTSFVIIVLGVLLALAIILPSTSFSLPDSPRLDLSVDGTQIKTTQGRFCGDAFLGTKCVTKNDFDSTFAMGMNHDPVMVLPNSKIKFNFDKTPSDGTLIVKMFKNEGDRKRLDNEDNVIVAPKKEGVYVYYISAEWEKNNMFANYAFSIKVK